MDNYYSDEELVVIGSTLRKRLRLTAFGATTIFTTMYFNGFDDWRLLVISIHMVIGVSISLYILDGLKHVNKAQISGNIYGMSLLMLISILLPESKFESLFFLQGCLSSLIYSPLKKNKNLFFYLYVILLIGNQFYEFFLSSADNELTFINKFLLVFGFAYLIPSIVLMHKSHSAIAEISYQKRKEVLKQAEIIKTSELKLKKSNQQLSAYIEKNLQLENFVHLSSHELLTPLHNVLNYTGLLKRRAADKLNDEEKEFLAFIKEGGTDIHKKITSLSEYSSISNATPVKELIDTHLIINKAIDELNKSGCYAEVNILEIPLKIEGDEKLLRKVFKEIVKNSCDFQSNIRPLEINVSGKEEAEQWVFKISDNGIGISAEYQDKVFLIFKKLHTNETIKGIGFGLTLAKKIIELHEGKIWFESQVNKGTDFYFSLPKA